MNFFKGMLIKLIILFLTTTSFAQTKEMFDKAFNVVVYFETSKSADNAEAWGKITRDFDGNGLSVGAIQFNIGRGTLQPLIKKIGREKTLEMMPKYGPEFWAAIHAKNETADVDLVSCGGKMRKNKTSKALELVRSYQNIVVNCVDNKLKRVTSWKKENSDFPLEFSNLLTSEIGKEKQREQALQDYGISAWSSCQDWVKTSRGEQAVPTVREYAAFLDNAVFNGPSLGKLNFNAVQTYKKNKSSENLKNEILIWLASGKDPSYQVYEAKKNSSLWKNRINSENLDFIILWYLRAKASVGDEGKFKWNVLSRRGTIIFNDGWINLAEKTFRELE